MGNAPGLSEGGFFLLRYGLFLSLLFHLTYVGAVAAGSAVSLAANVAGRDTGNGDLVRFARKIMEALPLNPALAALLGILPLVPAALVSRRMMAGTDPLGWPFWALAAALDVVALALLRQYRAGLGLPPDRQARPVRLGAAGVLAAASALFLVAAGMAVLLDPEKLHHLARNPVYILSWNGVVRFLFLIVLAAGIAGGVILLLPAHPGETKEPEDAGAARRGLALGTTLSLAAALPVPIFAVLHLATLPDVALSRGVVAFAATAVAMAFGAALPLGIARLRGEGRSGGMVFTLNLLILCAFLLGDYVALGNAYEGRRPAATVAAAARQPAAPEAAAPAAEATAAGKAVFDRVCASCHRFDSRLVGPPLNERVPKYGGDVEKLKAFIRNPAKVSPDYPAMPALGLPEEEIDAVARYLLAEAGKGSPPAGRAE